MPGVFRDDLNVRTLVKAYVAGASAASLARRYDANIWTILDRLRKAGIRIRSRVEQNERRLDLSVTQTKLLRAIVDGLMLGDGAIDRKGLLRLEQAKIRYGWLKDVAERLASFGASSKIIKIPPRERLLKRRVIKSSGGHLLYTPAYVELQAERQRWYPKGQKIVPKDVDLSPLSLTYWLAGDGTGSRPGKLVFCSNGFKKHEVQFLADKLSKLYKVNAKPQKVYHRPGEFFVCINRRDDAVQIKNVVQRYIPTCCRYKLRFVRPTLTLKERREHQRRRLTNTQVRRIQVAHNKGTSIHVLALRYNVSPPTIRNALNRDVRPS